MILYYYNYIKTFYIPHAFQFTYHKQDSVQFYYRLELVMAMYLKRSYFSLNGLNQSIQRYFDLKGQRTLCITG